MKLREASCSSEKEISCSTAGCAADPIPLYNATVFNTGTTVLYNFTVINFEWIVIVSKDRLVASLCEICFCALEMSFLPLSLS